MAENTPRFDRGATAIDFFQDLQHTVATALAEDRGPGDITATLIPVARNATAEIGRAHV